MRRRDGSYYVNRSHLWRCVHAEAHQSKPSQFMGAVPERLKIWHKAMYPHDDPQIASLQPLISDDDFLEEVPLGDGMHIHLLMAYFWWSFSGDRIHKERGRHWENRLAAASCFRDFVQSILHRMPNEVTFHIMWGGLERRPCKLRHGVLDMQPLGLWRELRALTLLEHRWVQHAAGTRGNGLHWVRGSPYVAPLGDLLVGGAMLSNPNTHSDLLSLLRDVMAKLGNLVLALMPCLVTTDPRGIQVSRRNHYDKGPLYSWVDEVLHKGRFASLPALFRSMHRAGIGQLCSRIYKDWHHLKFSGLGSSFPGVVDPPPTYLASSVSLAFSS